MKQLLSLGLLMVLLTAMISSISGCTATKHKGDSSYEKSKSDYEKPREGSSGY